uniref:Cuticle protein 6 n=1 Tax=Clastoptera arizonana TaxID=38151 RepID=A0A1B6E477_9HEMI
MGNPTFMFAIWVAILGVSSAKIGGWDTAPNTQYHIQTDEGPERYFKYQTISGQYRKEKRLQDGTVVGTYGWVDPNGYLRLRDYIADEKGYRIVRTKKVLVGVDTPIANAVSIAKKVPSQGGVGVENAKLKPSKAPYATTYRPDIESNSIDYPSTTLSPISLSDHLKQSQYPSSTPSPPGQSYGLRQPIVVVSPNSYPLSPNVPSYSPSSFPTTTPAPYQEPPHQQYVQPQTFRPYFNPNSIQNYYYDDTRKIYNNVGAHKYDSGTSSSQQFPLYDGVSMTHNGFRYYLPRHYHEEETLPGEKRAGSFGYIDPFGIRRVIYYNADPSSGFVHRKNNRYVGFDSTPYDPRF